ncbi:MAG: RHS repeat-associated core domain-containing protein [Kosmotogaceae bacterium]
MSTKKTPLSCYSHGARYFDPQLATWHSPDPLSESSIHLSPYVCVANNPVNYVDPNGMYYAKGPSPLEREYTQEGRGLSFSTSLFWNPGRPRFWTAVPSFEDQYVWIEGSEGRAYVKRENILTFENSGDDAVSVYEIGFLTNNWSGSFDINGISLLTSEGLHHMYFEDNDLSSDQRGEDYYGNILKSMFNAKRGQSLEELIDLSSIDEYFVKNKNNPWAEPSYSFRNRNVNININPKSSKTAFRGLKLSMSTGNKIRAYKGMNLDDIPLLKPAPMLPGNQDYEIYPYILHAEFYVDNIAGTDNALLDLINFGFRTYEIMRTLFDRYAN